MLSPKKSPAYYGGARTKSKRRGSGSRVGEDLVEAFEEMAKHLRGEIELETHELPDNIMTPAQIKSIRLKVAPSTKEFERLFGICSRSRASEVLARQRPLTLEMIQKNQCKLENSRRSPRAAISSNGSCSLSGFHKLTAK